MRRCRAGAVSFVTERFPQRSRALDKVRKPWLYFYTVMAGMQWRGRSGVAQGQVFVDQAGEEGFFVFFAQPEQFGDQLDLAGIDLGANCTRRRNRRCFIGMRAFGPGRGRFGRGLCIGYLSGGRLGCCRRRGRLFALARAAGFFGEHVGDDFAGDFFALGQLFDLFDQGLGLGFVFAGQLFS